jgi:hypothetical protein
MATGMNGLRKVTESPLKLQNNPNEGKIGDLEHVQGAKKFACQNEALIAS